jgi:hypothetical protein
MSRAVGTRLQKSQQLRFVDFQGHRYKRIMLRDSYLASLIEHALESFGPTPHLPPLAARYEHEIWTEFIPGRPLQPQRDADIAALVTCFATLYCRAPQTVALAETPFPYRLWSDLRFLHRTGLISASQHDGLSELADAWAPWEVWLGFDYTDPVIKNFIIRDDDRRACAVDVESLEPQTLLGWGIAKAKARWLGEDTSGFLDRLAAQGSPDVRAYFRYVELCFLARWTKTGFLEQKWRYVQPERLTRLLTQP